MLEKETWTSFFRKAWNLLKDLFWLSDSEKNWKQRVSTVNSIENSNNKTKNLESQKSKKNNQKNSVSRVNESRNKLWDYTNKYIPEENVKMLGII